MTLTLTSKLAVPVAFFGYAAFANVSLLLQDVQTPSFDGLTKGAFAQEIDALYRDNLPHQKAAVGVVGAARYVLLNEGRKGVVCGEKGWLFSSEEFRAQDLETEQYGQLLEWITHVDQRLENLGSKLVIVALPAKIDVIADKIDAPEQTAALRATYDGFIDSLTSFGIAHVSTKAALEAVSNPFFQTDTHWTSEGASAVAAAVGDTNLIPRGDEVFEIVDHAKVTFHGDLVTFVTSETMAPLVGLLQETVVPYAAQLSGDDTGLGGLDLFGTAAPVAVSLVGTSYSANPNWSFAEALKQSLGHDVLNYAQEGRGPVAPMKDFLETIESEPVSPYVIWELPVRYLTDPALRDSLSSEVDPNA